MARLTSSAFSNRVKNKRELHSSLKGATLGDPDDDEESALKWVKKSKKKEKELAKKKQDDLARMEEGFLAEYTEGSLRSCILLCDPMKQI